MKYIKTYQQQYIFIVFYLLQRGIENAFVFPLWYVAQVRTAVVVHCCNKSEMVSVIELVERKNGGKLSAEQFGLDTDINRLAC